MSLRSRLRAASLLLVGAALTSPCAASAATLVRLDDIRPEKVHVAGFALDAERELTIETVGYRFSGGRRRDSSAWILNAQSRETVWTAREGEHSRESRRLTKTTDRVTLPAGRYEVYYSGYPQPWEDLRADSVGEVIRGVFTMSFPDRDDEDYEDASRDFYVQVEGEGRPLSAEALMEGQERLRESALLSFAPLKDGRYEARRLSVDAPVELEIYAIGEMNRNAVYDGSWILDTATRERVWTLDYQHSGSAGGASKNRVFRNTVSLPPGDYALFCATDDTHHFGDWNSAPPRDPFFWGITVNLADPAQARHVTLADYEDLPAKDVVLALTGLRDDDHASGGFTLKRPTRLRVYALGEGDDDELADTSWILDADTRETVWEFRGHRSEHAGGASKNRLVDTVIQLPAGNYIAHAVTDGSHATGDWNASPPFDRQRWGLTVSVTDGDRSAVADYDEGEDPAILAQIVGVGDNARERERFQLDRDGRVRVHALGEGESGRMYDYAWIEDDRGRTVWEMTARGSRHAGGVRKNRECDATVDLKQGEYTVHYRSDGSHSCAGWNADPPRDRWGWGVVVRKAD